MFGLGYKRRFKLRAAVWAGKNCLFLKAAQLPVFCAYTRNARACCLFLKSFVHVTKRLVANVSRLVHDAKSLQHDTKSLQPNTSYRVVYAKCSNDVAKRLVHDAKSLVHDTMYLAHDTKRLVYFVSHLVQDAGRFVCFLMLLFRRPTTARKIGKILPLPPPKGDK
jgi:hypothetical protein